VTASERAAQQEQTGTEMVRRIPPPYWHLHHHALCTATSYRGSGTAVCRACRVFRS
jgi:hypothetical protein